jgi:hypothetical protein
VQITYVGGEEKGSPVRGTEAFSLHLDPEQVARRIANDLRGHVFADARLVGSGMRSDDTSSEKDEAEVVRAAVAMKANMILECEIRIAPSVVTDKNDRFWPNLLLFAVGGPATWFVADRSYHFDAQLYAHLHQIEPLRDGAAAMSDRRARLVYAHAQVQTVDLHLIDRVGGRILPYVASVLVPAAFLVPEGGNVLSTLEDEVAARLADELMRQLAESQHQIAEGGLVTGIGLEDASVVRQSDGLWFVGTGLLRSGTASRLSGYSLHLGDETIDGTFDADVPRTSATSGRADTMQYPIAVRIPGPTERPAGARVELELFAGGRDRLRRSFCVPVVW